MRVDHLWVARRIPGQRWPGHRSAWLAPLVFMLTACGGSEQARNTEVTAGDDAQGENTLRSALESASLATGAADPRRDAGAELAQGEPRTGCTRTVSGAAEPEETDLQDGVTHYGILRECADGRPALLTIELVEYYEGEEAVREGAKDGEIVEPDVDPVMYVRTPSPPKIRQLAVKLDADVRMFDCAMNGCDTRPVHLDELPWNDLYRFQLQGGAIVYIELPYFP